ncbi:4'-phosphopantetheinyl transferase superfamily protein [[Mycoplasma] mobile]|nr:4'-phosphopantetheinyl transferase superfamily protein [[Mycoplasma] mobile]
MIGVDLTKISRFKNKSEKFAKRILSHEEFEKWEINKDHSFLATRWAIKEAIYKADNNFFEFSKINVKKDNYYWFQNFYISVSHEGDLIIAFVIKKEKNESQN